MPAPAHCHFAFLLTGILKQFRPNFCYEKKEYARMYLLKIGLQSMRTQTRKQHWARQKSAKTFWHAVPKMRWISFSWGFESVAIWISLIRSNADLLTLSSTVCIRRSAVSDQCSLKFSISVRIWNSKTFRLIRTVSGSSGSLKTNIPTLAAK